VSDLQVSNAVGLEQKFRLVLSIRCFSLRIFGLGSLTFGIDEGNNSTFRMTILSMFTSAGTKCVHPASRKPQGQQKKAEVQSLCLLSPKFEIFKSRGF